MEFATTHHSGLLLFNGRYDGQHDFIAVEVTNGQVQFRFSLFSKQATVVSNVNGGVSDGKWHTVEVSFQNQVLHLSCFINLDLAFLGEKGVRLVI